MSLLISFVTVFLFYPFLSSSQFTSNAFPQPTPIPGPISSALPQPGQVPAQFPVSSTFFQLSTSVGPAPTPGGFSSVNGPFGTTSYFTTTGGGTCYFASFNDTTFQHCYPNYYTSSSSGNNVSSLFAGGAIAFAVFIGIGFVFTFIYRRVFRAQQQPRSNVIFNEAINRNSNKKKKIVITQEELDCYPILRLEDFISQTAKVGASLTTPPNGLEKEQPHSYIEMGEDIECMICFEKINMDDNVRVIPCYHVFHSQCLDTWLTTQSCACPTCRLDLKLDHDEDNTNNIIYQTQPPNTTTYQMPHPNN
ncbi:hypothetical protein BB559_002174 [Furculomyces boomerangus]|uniref:RING-type domain-containing protein n=1 Tax=Furculomyces boomerangus TaxID=61424 RepID=A0A2T9YXG2_9FUNG|nr:hypothetical protein BB559_002174 [Furculomyces boomerangus]